MVRLVVSLLAATVCLCLGCGRGSTTVTGPDGQKTTVTKQGGKVHVDYHGRDGETVQVSAGENVSLPKDFPADVLIYAGAKVKISSESGDTKTVELRTADSSAKVLDFYRSALKSGGWKSLSAFNSAEGGMLGFTKGEKRTCSVIVGHSDNETSIVINVAGAK